MAADKPLSLPTRPLFRPSAPRIHTLATPDAVKAAARASIAAEVQADKKPVADKILADEVAARDAAQKAGAEVLAMAIMEHLAPAFDTLAERIGNDLYNNAVLVNPQAFAAVYGREKIVPVTDLAKPVKVYRNDLPVPVVVIGRADNAANDILSVLVSGGEVIPAEAQMHRNDGTFTAVLRPNQTLYAAVRLITGTTANIIYTVVPLRGRAAVFGG